MTGNQRSGESGLLVGIEDMRKVERHTEIGRAAPPIASSVVAQSGMRL